MLKHMTFTILLCCFCNVHALVFQTIGIFSICGDNYTQNEFTEFAYAMNLFVSKRFEIKRDRNRDGMYGFTNLTYTYKSFDVCYNTEKLVSLVTDFLLDPEYYAVNQSIVLEHLEVSFQFTNESYVLQDTLTYHEIKAARSTMIVRIITHVPTDMLMIVLDMMSLDNILISKHSSLVQATDRMNQQVNFLNIEDSFGDVEEYLISHKLEDVIVIHQKTGDVFTRPFHRMVRMLSNMNKVCFKTLTIDDENDSLRFKQNIEVMYNDSNRTRNFTLIKIGMKWEMERENYFENVYSIWLYRPPVPYGFFYRGRMVFLSNSIRESVRQNTDQYYQEHLYQYYRNYTVFNTIKKNQVAFREASNSIDVHSAISNIFHGKLQNKLSDLKDAINQYYKHREYQSNKYFNSIPKNIVNKCYHPICLPGYQKVFGILRNGTTSWDEEIGYYCQPCTANYIKASHGNAPCQPCTGYYVSNTQRTKCVDPLLPVYHKPGDTSGMITFVICSFGVMLCLLTIIIFIKFRQTPIVKTSDFIMSLIHLTAILLFFCNIPALYFVPPTPEICMTRTLSIALFYNLNISIIYTKSNKLVKAFSAKIRSTKSEVLKTTLMQTFAIIINLLCAGLLLVALWSQKYPKIAIRLNIEDTKKFLYCSNESDNIALSLLMLLLQLACFVQAFRCRKLPGHISEAMNIVYASFIVTVSLCVMFPIQLFQKYEENGEMVLALVLSGNNMILFLFMYTKKVFTMIFCPEKNTKGYFRRKQMEMIEVKARNI